MNELSDTPAAVLPRRIVFPDGVSRFDFDAILTGFESEASLDDKMSATVTFKLSGPPTLTQA
jgi:hypothetical protein